MGSMATSGKLNAPLLIPVLGWISGIILGKYLPLGNWYLILSALCLLSAIILPKTKPLALIMLFCCCGALRVQLAPSPKTPLRMALAAKDRIQKPLVFRVKTAFHSSYFSYGIISDSLAGAPLNANIIFYSEKELLPGRRYAGLAELRGLQSDPILDVYPQRYEARAYQKGSLDEQAGSTPSMWVDKLRTKLLDALDTKLGTEAGWAKALLFSDTAVKNEYRSELQQSGVLHLIVVSGLHVWFIYLVLISLFRIFLPDKLSELFFLAVILLFAALNGWAPSITRSIIMIGTLILAHWLQRPLSGAQNISLSLFIITLIQPLQLFSLGLQLSYISVAVLLFAIPRINLFGARNTNHRTWKLWVNRILEIILVSCLISMAIAPITLYHFGTASLNGIIGNLIGIPLSSLLLPLSAMILLVPQGSFICNALVSSYESLIWLWKKWIVASAALPFSINGHYFNSSLALAMATMILMLLILIRGKFVLAKRLAIPAGLMMIALLAFPTAKKQPDIHVFSAGVADCSLIRLPGGETLMIDTGGTFTAYETERLPSEESLLHNNWADTKLIPWLQRNRIKRIDHLLISHLHSDHSGGILAIMKNMEVEELLLDAKLLNHPLWQQLIRSPYFRAKWITAITDTCSFSYNGARLKILHPDKNFAQYDENERSVVCRLDMHGQRILFTGDIGHAAESYLVENYPGELNCNYLKVAHHGSRNSSSELFLKTCQPREAWLCCSNHNRFGFPHPETVQRYRKQQLRLRSTAEGSIRIKNEE